MKKNYYILLAFLFSISFIEAQTDSKYKNIEISNIELESNADEKINISSGVNIIEENDSVLMDVQSMKKIIARESSDIRIYLFRKRNEGNISLVFPKINKPLKA